MYIVNTGKPVLDEDFDQFHRDNPVVYRYFRKYAEELRDSGKTRGSSEQIIQRLRWELDIKTKSRGKDGVKIKNAHRTRYARLLVQDDETFKGFFTFYHFPGVPDPNA